MHFSKLLSLLALFTTAIALPIANPAPEADAAPAADASPYAYADPQSNPPPTAPSANVRQYVVNAQATIVSLINNFVQKSSPGANFDSVQNQLARIAQLTSISCTPFTPQPATTPATAISALTQTQNSLNQFNLDLVVPGSYPRGSFCSAFGYFRSVAGLAGRS